MARTAGEMPFLDHLEELRTRILRSLVAVVACFGLLGALIERRFHFRKPRLALPGQLLHLEELALYAGQIRLDAKVERPQGLAARHQRIHDPLLQADDRGQGGRAHRIAPGRLDAERADFALQKLDLTLGGAGGSEEAGGKEAKRQRGNEVPTAG